MAIRSRIGSEAIARAVLQFLILSLLAGPLAPSIRNPDDMKIVSADEMRALDRATSERFGVPSITLMENAGAALAAYVLTHHSEVRRIVVFCGKGNNGGDG